MGSNKRQIVVIQNRDKSGEEIYNLIRTATMSAAVPIIRDVSLAVTSKVTPLIQKASLVIADLTSESNQSVMFEIGFAISQNKPLLLIARSSRSIPFDLAGLRTVIYDSADPDEFVKRLSISINEALTKPSDFLYEQATAAHKNKQSVFISYSHSDVNFLDRLLVHLKPLEKEGIIDLWIDTRLRAGDQWKKEIEEALNKATVAILLISADFLASDFITENELPPLLKNAEERGTRILPLVVKPCRFTRDTNLRNFHAINDPKQSIVLLSFGEREVIYDQVAEEIERSLQRDG